MMVRYGEVWRDMEGYGGVWRGMAHLEKLVICFALPESETKPPLWQVSRVLTPWAKPTHDRKVRGYAFVQASKRPISVSMAEGLPMPTQRALVAMRHHSILPNMCMYMWKGKVYLWYADGVGPVGTAMSKYF
jgi:hypothetical protein